MQEAGAQKYYRRKTRSTRLMILPSSGDDSELRWAGPVSPAHRCIRARWGVSAPATRRHEGGRDNGGKGVAGLRYGPEAAPAT